MSETLPGLRICKHESKLPIIQGGMSIGLAGSAMAGEVAKAGGIGVIGGVGMGMSEEIQNHTDAVKANSEALANSINEAREIANGGVIGVNLMVATTDYPELVGVAVKNGIDTIFSGSAIPRDLPKYVMEFASEYGIPIEETPDMVPIVSSVRAALMILEKWKKSYGVLPAAFIVETPNDAGGHLGAKRDDVEKYEYSLEYVVPKLVETLKELGLNIPVIAAGGIWDRSDIDRMLRIGASGIQLSTRFLPTVECNADQKFKDRHVENTDPIVVTSSPVGLPGRAIENDFVRRVNAGEQIDLGNCVNCLISCEHRKTKKMSYYCIARALCNVRNGDVENGILFTGSNGHRLIEDRQKYGKEITVANIMNELVA